MKLASIIYIYAFIVNIQILPQNNYTVFNCPFNRVIPIGINSDNKMWILGEEGFKSSLFLFNGIEFEKKYDFPWNGTFGGLTDFLMIDNNEMYFTALDCNGFICSFNGINWNSYVGNVGISGYKADRRGHFFLIAGGNEDISNGIYEIIFDNNDSIQVINHFNTLNSIIKSNDIRNHCAIDNKGWLWTQGYYNSGLVPNAPKHEIICYDGQNLKSYLLVDSLTSAYSDFIIDYNDDIYTSTLRNAPVVGAKQTIYKFDGNQWHTISLPRNMIDYGWIISNLLLIDEDSKLWLILKKFSDYKDHLFYYKDGQFVNVLNDVGGINSLFIDPFGFMWIGGYYKLIKSNSPNNITKRLDKFIIDCPDTITSGVEFNLTITAFSKSNEIFKKYNNAVYGSYVGLIKISTTGNGSFSERFSKYLTNGIGTTKLIYYADKSSKPLEQIQLTVSKQGKIQGQKTIVVKSHFTNVKEEEISKVFSLSQNYPNPFNPSTTIKYELPERSFVKIILYDLLGRDIKTLVNEEKDVGYYEVQFNARNLASGIYFYRIEATNSSANNFTQTRKMVLLR